VKDKNSTKKKPTLAADGLQLETFGNGIAGSDLSASAWLP
jgi:hypothetical protein